MLKLPAPIAESFPTVMKTVSLRKPPNWKRSVTNQLSVTVLAALSPWQNLGYPGPLPVFSHRGDQSCALRNRGCRAAVALGTGFFKVTFAAKVPCLWAAGAENQLT